MRRLLVAVTLALAAVSTARAQAHGGRQRPRTHALVIGSNSGGPGQQALRFSEADAARFADALVEVGRFDPADVIRLLHPTRRDLEGALSELEASIAAERAAGSPTVVLVYYSGHARAQAINLGSELFELATLRERILAMPGDLKVVVLDACQSGAFSSPKGADPAADFSYNSVDLLRTEGVAVMASSSASELSQESEALQASYFTHHLLVAMRGAGDANHDGQVTLSETYQYAYHRTLAATAATAIGGQHVTLETELRGQGDVPFSFPAEANAHLVLESALDADLVVTHVSSRSVVAEVHKAGGRTMQLALPAGRYAASVRQGARVLSCDLLVASNAPTVLSTSQCAVVPEPDTRAKGDDDALLREAWALQLALGLGGHRDDGFVDRLREFGYGESGNHVGRFALGASYLLSPHVVLGVQLANLDSRRFARDTQDVVQGFEWYAYNVGPFLRMQPAWRSIVPYLEVGAGLSFAQSTLDEIVVTDPSFVPLAGSDDLPPLRRVERDRWHAGAYFSLAGGLQWMPWQRFGFYGQLVWSHAPTIGNRLGDTHDAGGVSVMVGARWRATEEP